MKNTTPAWGQCEADQGRAGQASGRRHRPAKPGPWKLLRTGTNLRPSYLNPSSVAELRLCPIRILFLTLSKMPNGFWPNLSSRTHGGIRRLRL